MSCSKDEIENQKIKVGASPLPAQLYVSEAAKSAQKAQQERLTPDPDDAVFAALLKETAKLSKQTKGEAHENS